MNIFQDSKGSYSSKRTMGVIYMLGAFAMAFIDQVTKFEINSFEVWVTIVVTGATMLGISLFDGKMPRLDKIAGPGGHPDPDKEEK